MSETTKLLSRAEMDQQQQQSDLLRKMCAGIAVGSILIAQALHMTHDQLSAVSGDSTITDEVELTHTDDEGAALSTQTVDGARVDGPFMRDARDVPYAIANAATVAVSQSCMLHEVYEPVFQTSGALLRDGTELKIVTAPDITATGLKDCVIDAEIAEGLPHEEYDPIKLRFQPQDFEMFMTSTARGPVAADVPLWSQEYLQQSFDAGRLQPLTIPLHSEEFSYSVVPEVMHRDEGVFIQRNQETGIGPEYDSAGNIQTISFGMETEGAGFNRAFTAGSMVCREMLGSAGLTMDKIANVTDSSFSIMTDVFEGCSLYGVTAIFEPQLGLDP